MKAGLRKGYPLVHIASHFQFTPGDDRKSFLLLGKGNLPVNELRMQNRFFRGVELLTLSACNTGMGDGKEVEGFGVLAQRQGARGVVVTLWPVADASTSLFMQKFYQLRESEKLTKGEALRRAQLVLLKGEVQDEPGGGKKQRGVVVSVAQEGEKAAAIAFTPDPKAPYSHPYYWAPFFLMGNWK